MKVLRWAVKIHKWVALIIGLQIVLWIAGGVVMSVIPIEKVRGEHKIAEHHMEAIAPESMIDLKVALKNMGFVTVKEASLGTVLGRPVWRITVPSGKVLTLNGMDGKPISPISKDMAEKIARADYSGKGQIEIVEWVEKPPPEYGAGTPVWVARFDDIDNTTLYVNPDLAQVKGRRSTTWRFYDFFWKLHIMDYDDGDNFNNNLLRVASFLGIFVALSGMVLLFIKMRRSFLMWRSRRRET